MAWNDVQTSSDLISYTEWNDMVTVINTKASQDSIYAYTRTETAGESLTAGDVCYLKSDGKYWKADASDEATCSTDLLIATASISADASGVFGEYGYKLTTSGLSAGALYYASETPGAFTNTAPTTSTSIVRIVGTAESTTVFKFTPDISYLELS